MNSASASVFEKKFSASAFTVSWDSKRLKEADEAKKIYQQARLANRFILNKDKKPIQSFSEISSEGIFFVEASALKDGEMAFRILDETGDQRLIWNMHNPNQIEEAKKRFEEHIKKGGKAFAIFRDGGKAHRIKSFLEEREEIILEDKTTGTKIKSVVDVQLTLRNFIKKIYEVKLLPKTYPG